MQTQEWTFTDKSAWGDGPWQGEIDKRQWTDAVRVVGDAVAMGRVAA